MIIVVILRTAKCQQYHFTASLYFCQVKVVVNVYAVTDFVPRHYHWRLLFGGTGNRQKEKKHYNIALESQFFYNLGAKLSI